MGNNNLSETLRNYANRDDVDVVFQCVLHEAADRLERIERERENLEQEVHYLHSSHDVSKVY